MVKPANVSEERTASIFRVTESIPIEAEVMWQEKKCFTYVWWFEMIWPVTALVRGRGDRIVLSQFDLRISKTSLPKA